MDTISREGNNSMLPVGGIIVGVVALLLGGYAAMSLSKINQKLTTQEERVAKVEAMESQITTAAADAARANKGIADYARQTQEGFNTVSAALGKLTEDVVKLQDVKKPAVGPSGPMAAGKKSAEPPTAGPDEYVVKAGDSSGTKIAAAHGISVADLQAVNPGVDWTKLHPGQKLKLPAKH